MIKGNTLGKKSLLLLWLLFASLFLWLDQLLPYFGIR